MNKMLMVIFMVCFLPINLFAKEEVDHSRHGLVAEFNKKGKITHYTCGMHPSVNISVEEYKKGNTLCPICNMKLIPVREEIVENVSQPVNVDVFRKVKIKQRELQLAGVETEQIKLRKLFKEIRAVGSVAYDPQLAIAQDELVSAGQAYERSKNSQDPGVIERAKSLVESSKKKLQLLGLNEEQINELSLNKQIETSLILPGEKMWVYGDVFEYELKWIRAGLPIIVEALSLEGQEFKGEIVSINPVLDPNTRSVRFRALIDNKNKNLKPEMFVNIKIESIYQNKNGENNVLAVPKEAVLDTGERKVVWVKKEDGTLEGREVKVGPIALGRDDRRKYYPVMTGLAAGDVVVTRGNFLIDSQSQITGVAAAAYGGSLSAKESTPKVDPHAGHR